MGHRAAATDAECDDLERPGHLRARDSVDWDNDGMGRRLRQLPDRFQRRPGRLRRRRRGRRLRRLGPATASSPTSDDNCPATPERPRRLGTCFEGDRRMASACQLGMRRRRRLTGVCQTESQDSDDNDDVGDVCDVCPVNWDPSQSNVNRQRTETAIGDVCEPNDDDNDGWPDARTTARTTFNPDQRQCERRRCECPTGLSTATPASRRRRRRRRLARYNDDNCPNDPTRARTTRTLDGDRRHLPERPVHRTATGDGWPDSDDNCPENFNPSVGASTKTRFPTSPGRRELRRRHRRRLPAAMTSTTTAGPTPTMTARTSSTRTGRSRMATRNPASATATSARTDDDDRFRRLARSTDVCRQLPLLPEHRPGGLERRRDRRRLPEQRRRRASSTAIDSCRGAIRSPWLRLRRRVTTRRRRPRSPRRPTTAISYTRTRGRTTTTSDANCRKRLRQLRLPREPGPGRHGRRRIGDACEPFVRRPRRARAAAARSLMLLLVRVSRDGLALLARRRGPREPR